MILGKNEHGCLFLVQIPRIEFYEDMTYARTEKETDEIFKKFSIKYSNVDDAFM
mgnify:FL=1